MKRLSPELHELLKRMDNYNILSEDDTFNRLLMETLVLDGYVQTYEVKNYEMYSIDKNGEFYLQEHEGSSFSW